MFGLDRLKPGVVILNRFCIEETLGEGGYGCVFKAFDLTLKRSVALKILKTHLELDIDKFTHEAKLLARLNHLNIVKVFAVDTVFSQYPMIVMEFLAGETLQKKIANTGAVGFDAAVEILKQLCDGLEYAHQDGIIHRDLSPNNILLIQTHHGLQVKIIDFGLSKLLENTGFATATGALVGNPLYMSPEACRGEKATLRSDIYSVGCIFFEMITGQPPFRSDDTMGILYKHLHEYPNIPLLNLSDENKSVVKKILLHCLQKDPNSRPQSAHTIIELLSDSPVDLKIKDNWFLLASSKPNNSQRWVLAIVIALAMLLVFYYYRRFQSTSLVSGPIPSDKLSRLEAVFESKRKLYGSESPKLISPVVELISYWIGEGESKQEQAMQLILQIYPMIEKDSKFEQYKFDYADFAAHYYLRTGNSKAAEYWACRAASYCGNYKGKIRNKVRAFETLSDTFRNSDIKKAVDAKRQELSTALTYNFGSPVYLCKLEMDLYHLNESAHNYSQALTSLTALNTSLSKFYAQLHERSRKDFIAELSEAAGYTSEMANAFIDRGESQVVESTVIACARELKIVPNSTEEIRKRFVEQVFTLALIKILRHQSKAAKSLYDEASDYLELHPEPALRIDCLQRKAMCDIYEGNLKSATEGYRAADILMMQLSKNTVTSDLLRNRLFQASSLLNANEFLESELLSSQVDVQATKLHDLNLRAEAVKLMADCELGLKHKKKAFVFFETALSIEKNQNQKNLNLLLDCYRQMANIEIGDRHFCAAEFLLENAVTASKDSSYIAVNVDIYESLANLKVNRGKYKDAEFALSTAVASAKTMNLPNLLPHLYSCLAKCFQKQNRFSEYAKYKRLSEQHFN